MRKKATRKRRSATEYRKRVRNHRSAAVFVLGSALLLAGACTAPHISSGKIALNQGDNNEAIRQFTLAIEQQPQSADAYYWRGITYARKKLWAEYATDTEKAFSLESTLIEKAKKGMDTDDHSVYFFYSARKNYFDDKDYELSLKRAETSILFNPENVYSLNLKALCLSELARYEEAENAFQKAIAVKPNFMDSYIYLAGFYKGKAEYEKEEETLRKAKMIVDNPQWFGTVNEDSLKVKKADAAKVYHDLGANLFNQYELDEASLLLRKAMEFDPESRDIAYDLGIVLIEQEGWQEAAKTFARVIQIDPLDFYAHYYLGFSFLMLKEYLNAIKEFTWVIGTDNTYCDAYFKRAMCYRELGNSVAAYSDVKLGKECEECNRR
jgi:tetratricopeptide (TPR) repeat protein